MKTISLCITVILCSIQLLAQVPENNTNAEMQNDNVRISLMTPGISFEKYLFNNFSIDLNLWTHVYGYGNERDFSSEISKNAMVTLEPRYYLNVIDNIPFIFLGVPISVGIDSKLLQVAPGFGIQNNINNALFWNIGFGYGFKQVDLINRFSAVGYFSIGFSML